MRFIHTADLHLDSPLRGLARYDGAPIETIRNASRVAFANLVHQALTEQVDLVVIAGDVFDGDWRDFNTGLYFTAQLSRLTRENIAVVLLAGNHDAAGSLTKHLPLPAGAHRLSHRRCETIRPEVLGVDVAVHGQSYATRAVTDNLVHGYPGAEPGVTNIGVLHSALAGREGHEPYAPCTVEDLRAAGYDYWALGHVHQREVVSTDPHIVFCGNLQGRHIRESGPKGYTLVTTDGRDVVDVTERHVDVVRWSTRLIDATAVRSTGEIDDLLRDSLEAARVEADGRLAAVRVVVSGVTQVHDELHQRFEEFEALVRSRANELSDIWVEKVKVVTTRPTDLRSLRDRDDAIGPLLRSLESLSLDGAELAEHYGPRFARLRTKLPPAALASVDPTRPDVLHRALVRAESHLATLWTDGTDR